MSRKHDAALVALAASTALGSKFYPGIVPALTAPPYAVFWSSDGTDEATRATGPARTQHPRWAIHFVGTTVDQAKWGNEQLKSKLIVNGFGIVPTVAGENPGKFWYSNPLPVDRDDDSTPPLFSIVAECGFASDLL